MALRSAGAARIERFKQFVRFKVERNQVTEYVIAFDAPKQNGRHIEAHVRDVFTVRIKPQPHNRSPIRMLDSTVSYTDDRGYDYVGMSPSWKTLCLELPCSKRVVIEPVYKTQWIKTTLAGEDVVIQVWKGHIPKGLRAMPGGIGGEVGVYRLVPGRKIPEALDIPALSSFPPATQPFVRTFVSKVLKELVEAAEHGVELWWPFPELNSKIDMWFTNPKTGDDFFTASPSEPAGGYWMSRWMNYGSYVDYIARENLRVPPHAHEYVMEFCVGGKRFRWANAEAPIEVL